MQVDSQANRQADRQPGKQRHRRRTNLNSFHLVMFPKTVTVRRRN